MRPSEKILELTETGFTPLPILLGEWRRRGARRAIPSSLVVATKAGKPTVAFQGICKAAFNRSPPTDAIVDAEGRASGYFILWLHRDAYA